MPPTGRLCLPIGLVRIFDSPATLARGIGLVGSESTMPFFEKAAQYGLDQASAPYGAKLL